MKKIRKLIWLFSWYIIASPSIGLEKIDIDKYEEEAGEDLSNKEKIIQWLHHVHCRKNFGEDDSHAPSFIKFRPTDIETPFDYQIPKEFRTKDDLLNLNSVSANNLITMPPEDFNALILALSKVSIEIKWSDKKGRTQSGHKRKFRAHHLSHWDKSNAAAVLALEMLLQGHSEIFISIVYLAPDIILPELRGYMPALLNAKIMARLFEAFISDLYRSQANPEHISLVISGFMQRILKYWIGKDKDRFQPYFSELFYELSDQILLVEQDEKGPGLLLGSILAGAMLHIESVKAIDQHRIWLIGFIANLVWASTSFLGAAPIAMPISATLAGGISIGAVVTGSMATALKYPREFLPELKKIQGRLEMAILNEHEWSNEEKTKVMWMFQWMRTALHVNGLYD